MKNKPIGRLSRRGWQKSGAVFLGAFLMGCQKPAKETAVDVTVKPFEGQGYRMSGIEANDGQSPSPELIGKQSVQPAKEIAVDVTVEPFEDQGYRMYGIEAKDGQSLSPKLIGKLGILPDYLPFQYFSRRFRLPPTSGSRPDAAPVFQYVLWALPEQIESLGAIDGITVVQKLPEHVIEVGDQAMDGGMIAVKCLPNIANGNWQGRPCATLVQIVALWQNQFKGERITVTVVPEEATAEKSFGQVVDAEQIIIRFESPDAKRKILELVKEHPQTLILQWGKPFTHFHCPGCGMG